MIIDCHGHYTTAPKPLQDFRDAQIACDCDAHRLAALTLPRISDDQIRDSLEGAQLKLQRERGTDLTVFSPRASATATRTPRCAAMRAARTPPLPAPMTNRSKSSVPMAALAPPPSAAVCRAGIDRAVVIQ